MSRSAAPLQWITMALLAAGLPGLTPTLMLSLLADGGILVWEPAGSWQVSGPLLLRQQPAWSAPVLGRLASGTLVDNLGCQRSQGRLWCQVQQRGGGLRGYVPADQLQPAPKR